MDFSPEALRKHRDKKAAEQDAINAKLQPLRDELDDLVSGETKLSAKAATAREAKVREKIRELQNQLFPVDMEHAAVCRALGGKSMTAENPVQA